METRPRNRINLYVMLKVMITSNLLHMTLFQINSRVIDVIWQVLLRSKEIGI